MKKLILSFVVIASMGLSCKDEIAKPKFEPTINLLPRSQSLIGNGD